jgi:hypothetical protein
VRFSCLQREQGSRKLVPSAHAVRRLAGACKQVTFCCRSARAQPRLCQSAPVPAEHALCGQGLLQHTHCCCTAASARIRCCACVERGLVVLARCRTCITRSMHCCTAHDAHPCCACGHCSWSPADTRCTVRPAQIRRIDLVVPAVRCRTAAGLAAGLCRTCCQDFAAGLAASTARSMHCCGRRPGVRALLPVTRNARSALYNHSSCIDPATPSRDLAGGAGLSAAQVRGCASSARKSCYIHCRRYNRFKAAAGLSESRHGPTRKKLAKSETTTKVDKECWPPPTGINRLAPSGTTKRPLRWMRQPKAPPLKQNAAEDAR